MKYNKSKLGRVIKEIRLAQKMTQKELAERVGLTVNYLSLLENGKRGIGMDGLSDLSGVFGIPPELLVMLAADGYDKTDEDASRLLEQIQRLTRQAIALYTAR